MGLLLYKDFKKLEGAKQRPHLTPSKDECFAIPCFSLSHIYSILLIASNIVNIGLPAYETTMYGTFLDFVAWSRYASTKMIITLVELLLPVQYLIVASVYFVAMTRRNLKHTRLKHEGEMLSFPS